MHVVCAEKVNFELRSRFAVKLGTAKNPGKVISNILAFLTSRFTFESFVSKLG